MVKKSVGPSCFSFPPPQQGRGSTSRVGPKWLKSENVLNLRNFIFFSTPANLEDAMDAWLDRARSPLPKLFFDDPQGRGSTSRVGQNRHKVKMYMIFENLLHILKIN